MTAYIAKAKTVEWETPQDLFDELDAEFHFNLDVASTDENAKCPKHFTAEDDGLTQSWGDTDNMTIHIVFDKDGAKFSHNRECVEALSPGNEGILKTIDTFVLFDEIERLNYYIDKMATVQNMEEVELIQVSSFATLILEASEHPEYQTPYMLKKFSDSIFWALDSDENNNGEIYGFMDLLDDNVNPYATKDLNVRTNCLTNSITSEMLHDMYENTYKPNYRDAYTCRANSIAYLSIQVVYAILMHLFRTGKEFRVCPMCQRVFIPSRSNKKYCCKECGDLAKQRNPKVNHTNEISKQYNRLVSRIKGRIQRAHTSEESYNLSYQLDDFREKYRRAESDEEAMAIIEKFEAEHPAKKTGKGAKSETIGHTDMEATYIYESFSEGDFC